MSRKNSTVAPGLSSPALNRLEFQEMNRRATATAATTTATATAARSTAAGLTSIHVTALDGIVNVNSLFTMAMFIGLSMTVPENATTARARCTVSTETVRRLIVFEVLSFTFFLFSSLVAQSLKLQINLRNGMAANDPDRADVNATHLKYCLFASAVGSVLGCTFLTMSIVDFIRVKLGSLSCGGKPVYAVVTLLVFVGSGLLVYVITAGYTLFSVQEQVVKYEEEEEEAAAAAAIAAATTQ